MLGYNHLKHAIQGPSKCDDWKFKGDQCVVLFDDERCKGWDLPFGQGYHELHLFKGKNDAESLIVRPGCIFKVTLMANNRRTKRSKSNPH